MIIDKEVINECLKNPENFDFHVEKSDHYIDIKFEEDIEEDVLIEIDKVEDVEINIDRLNGNLKIQGNIFGSLYVKGSIYYDCLIDMEIAKDLFFDTTVDSLEIRKKARKINISFLSDEEIRGNLIIKSIYDELHIGRKVGGYVSIINKKEIRR